MLALSFIRGHSLGPSITDCPYIIRVSIQNEWQAVASVEAIKRFERATKKLSPDMTMLILK